MRHFFLCLFFLLGSAIVGAQDMLSLTPPAGWQQLVPAPEGLEYFFTPEGHSQFLPAITLAKENFSGTLESYLKIVKQINQKNGSEWKDLGMMQTSAGSAHLSQTDLDTERGRVQMLHLILQENGVIYIVTAMALKEDFSRFHKLFFDALRSIRIERALSGYRVENYRDKFAALF